MGGGVEGWNVDPLAAVAPEVRCLGEDSKGRKEESRMDTYDLF